jgi:hypothetical protein
MLKPLASLALASVLAFSAAPASADVIVDTGAPPFPSAGWALGDFNELHISLAAAFSLSQQTRITDFESFFGRTAESGSLHMGIAHSLGDVPGAEIFSSQIHVAPHGGTDFHGWFGVHGANVVLDPGEYWITFVVRPEDTYSNGLTFYAPNPTVKEAQMRSVDGPWSARNDLDFSLRVLGDPTAAVPEPAAWALMIAGFGAVGGALRRRQRACLTAA